MGATEVYTDGACLGNPGPGGWAALLLFGEHEREISGAELDVGEPQRYFAVLVVVDALATWLFTPSEDANENLRAEGADVVMILRIQRERQDAAFFPSMREYAVHYGLQPRHLERAAPDAIVMHPGPMNRGVEISSEIADGSRSLILDQVTNGVAVRMAVLYLLAGGSPSEPAEEKPQAARKQKRERK